jgi:exopolysaccharide production protein ExoQ
MPPRVALLFGIIFVAWVLRVVERNRDPRGPSDILWPFIWFCITATHEVGIWLHLWGVPLPMTSGDESEGSAVDRWAFLFLAAMGLRVLARRHIAWKAIFRENAWLVALFAFMFLSIAWSDYPFVSFKRYIKTLSSAVMVLVVLTDSNPYEAMLAILRRCAYITVPLTIVVIKYFRNIGIEYDPFTGSGLVWKGLASSKNTMGQAMMCCAICLLIEVLRDRKRKSRLKYVNWLYLLMTVFLLKGSDKALSVTSFAVFTLGILVFILTYLFRDRLSRISSLLTLFCIVVFSLVGFLVVHTISPFPEDSAFGMVIRGLGRDITLSGRTGIWADVLKVGSRDPLLGVGYGGFWIGRAANIQWDANLSWVLAEAHNGYFDTYLQIGLIGVFLLFGLVVSSCAKIMRTLATSFDYGRFRLAFLLIILFVNVTETTFLRGEHLLWFVFLFVVTSMPATVAPPQPPMRSRGMAGGFP